MPLWTLFFFRFATYLTRPGAEVFDPPESPGLLTAPPAAANQAVAAEHKRVHNNGIDCWIKMIQ